jgi:glycosyltransferase involved in cell wall biosynthesis
MQEQVSVIIPVHNAGQFLVETLQSVLAQTHRNFELITIDDGSTDASYEILKEFARRDARIVALHRKHQGVAATANEGLDIARNELVARIDADDLMLPQRLERQLSFMHENPEISVTSSYAWLIDRRHRVIGQSKPKVNVGRGIKELNPECFVHMIQSCSIMRRADIRAVGGYSSAYTFAEDRELWGRLVASGYRLAVQTEFLSKVRLHRSSLTAAAMRRNGLTCRFIDHNIVRLLQGQACLSFDAFLVERRKSPLLTRIVRNLTELGELSYKQATRDFAECEWWQLLKHGLLALCLNPVWGIQMFQKVVRGRLPAT